MTMTTNGDTSVTNNALLPVLPAGALQIAVDALQAIAAQAKAAADRLVGLTGPTPYAGAGTAATASASASEDAELAALMQVVPASAADALRTWRVQKELVATAFPSLATTPPTAGALPTNKISVQAFWWGFHFVVPEPVMNQFSAGGTTRAGVVAAIASATGPAAPFVAAGAAYIAAEMGLMKTVDHGKGVYVSMSWFAPGIFVPTSI